MGSKEEKMVSIWSWSAAILGLYAVILLAMGSYRLIVDTPAQTKMAELHADIWWPGFMLVVALGLYLAGRAESSAD